MRGYCAGAAQPCQPMPDADQSDGSSGSMPTRSGMLLPAMVQPMLPLLSATSRFCGGMPRVGASCSASATFATCSIRSRPRL